MGVSYTLFCHTCKKYAELHKCGAVADVLQGHHRRSDKDWLDNLGRHSWAMSRAVEFALDHGPTHKVVLESTENDEYWEHIGYFEKDGKE